MPSGFQPTVSWLKEIAAKYPRIKHLSLSLPCGQITVEDCHNPFEDFAKLNSLCLDFDTSHCADPQSIGAVLDRSSVTSLELLNLYSENPFYPRDDLTEDEDAWTKMELLVPGPVTTPNLTKSLVRLRLDHGINVQYFEYLMSNCHRLEKLWLEEVLDNGDEYPPLIESSHQMPQFLWSVWLHVSASEVYIVTWQ